MTNFPDKLFLVGCGNMGGAILHRWLDSGLDPARVTILSPSGREFGRGVQVVTDYPERLDDGTVIGLFMKPQQLAGVATRLNRIGGTPGALVSILAGIDVGLLRDRLPKFDDVFRVMPNMPVRYGKGVAALYTDARTSAESRQKVEDLMQPLGLVEWVREEREYNLVTAVSGCGPAFVYRFIDALGAAGTRLGLDEVQARRLALATVAGAAAVAADAEERPGVLADQVASPGGMTREGLDVLDENGRLNDLLVETLRAARDRGVELAKAN